MFYDNFNSYHFWNSINFKWILNPIQINIKLHLTKIKTTSRYSYVFSSQNQIRNFSDSKQFFVQLHTCNQCDACSFHVIEKCNQHTKSYVWYHHHWFCCPFSIERDFCTVYRTNSTTLKPSRNPKISSARLYDIEIFI